MKVRTGLARGNGGVGTSVYDARCFDSIQAAVDAAGAAGGGTVRIPPGTHKCNLVVGENVAIEGAGREATVLQSESQVVGEAIVQWWAGDYPKAQKGALRYLTIDGERQNASRIGLSLTNAPHFRLQDVHITGCTAYGLLVQSGTYWCNFEGLSIRAIGTGGSGAEGYGIYLSPDSNIMRFDGSHIAHTVYPGLWISGSNSVYFQGSLEFCGNSVNQPYGIVVTGPSTDVDLSLYMESNTGRQPDSADVRVVESVPGDRPSVRVRGFFNGKVGFPDGPEYAIRAQHGWVVLEDGTTFVNYDKSLFWVYDSLEEFVYGRINPGWGSYAVADIFRPGSGDGRIVR